MQDNYELESYGGNILVSQKEWENYVFVKIHGRLVGVVFDVTIKY